MPLYKTGKTKNGKQGYRVVVNYTDVNGIHKKKTKVVYGAPEAKLAEQQLSMITDDDRRTSPLTVGALAEEYLRNQRAEVRETTLSTTAAILRRSVLPFLGGVRLDKLDVRKLQEWKNTINEQDLSLSTKQGVYAKLRALFNYAVKVDYLPRNPLDRVGNFKEVYFTKSQDKLQYYTPDQFHAFIEVAKKAAEESPAKRGFYVFFMLAYYTGARKGEINALKWSDIEGNVIHIRRSVAQKVKGQAIVETPPKNKSSYRDIQIPSKVVQVLDEHKAYQAQVANFSENFRVCGGPNCLSDTNIARYNNAFADAANLPHIRIHDFRHSLASLLVNEGINIMEVARRLGHAKVEQTWQIYSHLYPREEERALKILENI